MLTLRRLRPAGIMLATFTFLAPLTVQAQTTNDALLRLLQILRDRGSITTAEYEEIRQAAGAPPFAPLDARVALQEAAATTVPQVAAQGASIAALEARTEKASTDIVRATLAGKWYERISLRGYTQFRLSDVLSSQGAPLEVPADRSVAANESLTIRRGRFVFSGDISDHLALYAQSDFNGSTGAADYSLQMRDLYGDVALNKAKTFRVRLGQSKVPFGFVNMQSSQNRGPMERPDPLNSAVEGERDLGAYLMWAPAKTRQMFRELVNRGLKGSGDYGVIAIGAFGGQGLNRSDQNGDLHWLARASSPFTVAGKQIVELGVQAYVGKFVPPTQAISIDGLSVTPTRPEDGLTDQRVGVSLVWYPQPIGLEAEWNMGRGPELATDGRRVETGSLHGGYLQLHYRQTGSRGSWFPFTRWQYYNGGRKFARNAPHARVNELDFGLEFAKWAELELTMMYTRTFERMRTSAFPYVPTRNANRLGFQAQWNY